jgi:NTP pyrophosphatase (non-canonical NTP hydrolase)
MNDQRFNQMDLARLESLIRQWGDDKGLLSADRIDRQFMKMVEEVGEVAECISKGKKDDLALEIGDVFVTLSLLAAQNGLNLTSCVKSAYDKIKGREGRIINNTFVKNEDL